MSEEHTENLNKARVQLVEQRREFARLLAGPYDRGNAEQARETFVDLQVTIEAIDRAIEDEERYQGSVYNQS